MSTAAASPAPPPASPSTGRSDTRVVGWYVAFGLLWVCGGGLLVAWGDATPAGLALAVGKDTVFVAVSAALVSRLAGRARAAAPQDKEAFTREVLDAIDAHVAVLDPAGRVLAVNAAWEAFAAANAGPAAPRAGAGADYLGVCDAAADGGCSDSRAAAAGIRRVLAGEAARFAFEYPCHSPTAERWFLMSVSPLGPRPGGAVVAHADISERKRAEVTLRDERDRFRGAFEHTNVAMVLTDVGNRFVRANDAFARFFGYTPAEVLGLTMADVTHPDHLAESYARREELLAGRADHFVMEKRYRHRDGGVLWGLTNVSLVRDAAGRPHHYVGQIQDITARKRAEEQVRQAQKMEAVGQLAGGVAHDFNNLLTVINGYTELLMADAPPGTPGREMLAAVRESGERAAGLTAQLLAFSRKSIVEPRVLDLNELIEQLARLLRRLIGEDVALATVLDPAVPAVRADPGQLEQVLMNLAVNARDAMPTGGRLTVSTRGCEYGPDAVPAAGVPPGRYAVLTVADTGVGMPAEVQARVFEPFFTTKGPGQGTGLGLATVYGIVAQAGGHVRLDSAVGRGAAFTVLLPAVAAAARRPPGGAAGSAPRGRETVLVAEDEERVRGLARLVLEAQGYTVLAAGTGAEAVGLAAAHPGAIGLLLTDVVMPDLGGRALADAVRAARPGVRVLYMSGYTDDAVVRHGVAAATDVFLQKPFTPLALARKVRAVLDGVA